MGVVGREGGGEGAGARGGGRQAGKAGMVVGKGTVGVMGAECVPGYRRSSKLTTHGVCGKARVGACLTTARAELYKQGR